MIFPIFLQADHVANEGEDSSYDSDNETNEHSPHQNVSRTTSDTLGQEFAEYVEHSAVSDLFLDEISQFFGCVFVKSSVFRLEIKTFASFLNFRGKICPKNFILFKVLC